VIGLHRERSAWEYGEERVESGESRVDGAIFAGVKENVLEQVLYAM
jgi:hypothetical protein